MKRFRLPIVAAGLCLAAAAALCFAAGELLSRPAPRSVGAPPADFPAQGVRITAAPGESVAGWFHSVPRSRGAVLLLHGVRTDRTQMLARARFLARAGYSTLLIDLPSHGESYGERITFGARESAGVLAALDFLRRERPGERLAVVGVSLGAAAIVLASPRPAPAAVVIESMYPTIDEAVRNRLRTRLGALGAGLGPLLLWQLPWRAGIAASDLRPIDRIPTLGAPVLVVSGAEDSHTTWAETRRIHDAARHPKALWRVRGAAHVDLHAFDPQAYESRILAFLAEHLRDA